MRDEINKMQFQDEMFYGFNEDKLRKILLKHMTDPEKLEHILKFDKNKSSDNSLVQEFLMDLTSCYIEQKGGVSEPIMKVVKEFIPEIINNMLHLDMYFFIIQIIKNYL